MAHLHSVYDSDRHFSIDAITRAIRNESEKNSLVQYDHNSERFTFELPRYVEEHDMALCNRVEIHYINIGAGGEQNASVYEVSDWQISPDDNGVVICSWLISANATQLAGSLNFLLRFACVADDGTIDYAWNTEICGGISVSNGMYNGEAVVAEFPDVLEAWKTEVLAGMNVLLDEAKTAAESAASSASAASESESKALRRADTAYRSAMEAEQARLTAENYLAETQSLRELAFASAAEAESAAESAASAASRAENAAQSAYSVLVVNAIETQTVKQAVSGIICYSFSDDSVAYYYVDVPETIIVQEGRNNYTIDGETAEAITIEGFTDANGATVQGLESASWKQVYHAGADALFWICKNSLLEPANTIMTITYDEESAETVTTIDTPLGDIFAAIDEGKEVICKWGNLTLRLAEYTTGQSVEFTAVYTSGTAQRLAYIRYDYNGITSGVKPIAQSNSHSNALKGNKSGSAVVLSDVSPIEHTLKVKARGENLIPYIADITSAKVVACGNNLFDVSSQAYTSTNGRANSEVLEDGTLRVLVAKTSDYIAVSCDSDIDLNVFENNKIYVSADTKTNGEGNTPTIILKAFNIDTGATTIVGNSILPDANGKIKAEADISEDIKKNYNTLTLMFYYNASTTDGWAVGNYIDYSNIMISAEQAEFEKYQSEEYPISVDGTVEGVTSLYPTTTLMSDTEGITLDVEYNRDINKAFAELQNAIISLGGNI